MTDAPRFLSPLRMETIGDRRWLLIDDLIFQSAKYRGIVVAPRGFQTDLASIPRLAWTFVPKVGKWDFAACVHDAGYGNALVTEHGDRIFAVKAVSDTLFLEGMHAQGVNGFLAQFMYRAVSLFGNPEGHPLANALPGDAVRPRQSMFVTA
jgi:hypothetical protein